MPPLPAVLSELLGILSKKNVTAGQVAALIERDTVLSGSVLRSVNSAYYGLPSKVSSIRHAVTLLGFSAIRNLAMVFSMKRMVSAKQPSPVLYASYSQHALAVAVMTQFLAHFTQSDDTEAAFAAGLFHDIGHLLVITQLPESIGDVDHEIAASGDSIEVCEERTLGITHAELGAEILGQWNLPTSILDSVRNHHRPEEFVTLDGRHGLPHLIYVADLYAKSQGLALFQSLTCEPASAEAAFAQIGLGERWPSLADNFQKQFESIRESIA